MKFKRLFILSVVFMACSLLMFAMETNEGMKYSLDLPLAGVGLLSSLIFCFLGDNKKE